MFNLKSYEMNEKTSYLVKRIYNFYINKHVGKLFIAFFFMIIVAACTAALVSLMKPVLDQVLSTVNQDFHLIPIICMAIIVLSIAKGIGEYGQSIFMTKIAHEIAKDLQLELYSHLLSSDLAHVQKQGSGRIISRFSHDIVILRMNLAVVLGGFPKALLTLIGLLFVVFYENASLAIYAFVVFPLAIYPIIRLGRRMRKVSFHTQEKMGEFVNQLDESFKNVKTIKAYNQEKFEINRATSIVDHVLKLYIKSVKISALSSPIMETLGGIAIAGIIAYGGWQVKQGITTAGSLVTFILAVSAAYKPLKTVSNINTSLQDGLAAANRLFKEIDIKPQIIDKIDAKELSVKQGDIEFKEVSFKYEPKKPALNKISITVPKGKTVALVGPSGGGKSTIMNLLLRFYDADSGDILIDGNSLSDVTIKSLRDNISFVGQDVALFDDSVSANIVYGSKGKKLKDVKQAAKMAAAAEFIEDLPEGYKTMIGPHGASLSGGQKQRISIARAILKDAPILLLDEATSALDNISEKKIQTALKQLMKGRTTLVIAHRLSTVIDADVIYVLKKGKVVESGTHKSLLAKKGEYEKLYKALDS